MSKRLLLISSNSSGRGGGERYLVYLTQGLRLLGWEVHILLSTASYMDNWAKELTIEGVQVHRRYLKGLRTRPLRFVQSILDKKQQIEVAKVCKQIAPVGILINQQYDEDGLDYLAGALMSKVAPVASTMHMPMTADKYKRPLGNFRGKLLRWWYEKHSYSLILVSEGSQKEFENYYSYPRPTKLINYGCSLAKETAFRPSLPVNWVDSIPIIGFSGQFVTQKNLQLLVDAWLWTRKKEVYSKLLLIGDGPERAILEKRLRNSAPEDTWYITGWQEHPEAYLSVLDIYAMTSQFEGLPLALIEAAGSGIPAVVTNFNGASDVAERASWVSVVIEPSAKSVGSSIIQTIKHLPLLKHQARDGQKEFQDHFSLQRMASETLGALGIA